MEAFRFFSRISFTKFGRYSSRGFFLYSSIISEISSDMCSKIIFCIIPWHFPRNSSRIFSRDTSRSCSKEFFKSYPRYTKDCFIYSFKNLFRSFFRYYFRNFTGIFFRHFDTLTLLKGSSLKESILKVSGEKPSVHPGILKRFIPKLLSFRYFLSYSLNASELRFSKKKSELYLTS